MATYEIAWRRYRLWRRARWSGLLVLVACCVTALRFPGEDDALVAAGFGLTAAFGFAAFSLAVQFRCPRCGERFFRGTSGLFYYPLTRSCMHCGLPKWEVRG